MIRLSRDRAEEMLASIQGQQILVFGDLMLDEYLFGEVNRISPEAPVPIVRVTKEKWVLGGAANVASNLRSMGAEPLLAGIVGSDEAGARIRKKMLDMGAGGEGLVDSPSQPTTIKTRVIGQHQQMLRIDREVTGLPNREVLEKLMARLRKMAKNASAIIISDYAKGAVCPHTIDTIREVANNRRIPWIVDPKPAHKGLYSGASALTPNAKELSELTGLPATTDAEMDAASSKLVSDLGLAGLLVTRSEKGVALVVPDGGRQSTVLIPTDAKEVFDVSGAGDTVIAAFTAALAAKAAWPEAAMLANVAAGVVVAKMGTATASPMEILSRL